MREIINDNELINLLGVVFFHCNAALRQVTKLENNQRFSSENQRFSSENQRFSLENQYFVSQTSPRCLA